jgi:hypothetical protein
MTCVAAADGALKNCQVAGKATASEEAAMRALAAQLISMSQTKDGIAVVNVPILVFFNWKELWREAQNATG